MRDSQRQTLPSEPTKQWWLSINGGIAKPGSLIAPPSVIQKNLSSLTWVFSGQSSSVRQSGSSLSSATGSITAPDRMCAPTSEPFSTTTTLRSAFSCLSRIAAVRPDGPAPTMTTSNSMDSRAGNSSVLISLDLKARLVQLDVAPAAPWRKQRSNPRAAIATMT
ncbi:hypothetical protein BRAS3809_7800001 [Bradyrhizobium sp. STM 3809]|nr:hypothetical protein BRAS3809_7800001 [Bradyrhizobium sp. STM 3809]